MSSDRRSVYRVSPENSDQLELALKNAPGAPLADQIVDITLEGAATLFARKGAPSLAIGDCVKLSFRSPKLCAPVEVEATVTARKELPEQQHYSFQFLHQDALERALPDEFFRLFNRRGALRIMDIDDAPVDVRPLDRESPFYMNTTTARLKNISTSGLGAIADVASETMLADVRSVELSLCLPDRERPIRIAAWIRNREVHDEVIYYGLMFDAKHTEDYLEQAEEIVDFVMCRYQEKLDGQAH